MRALSIMLLGLSVASCGPLIDLGNKSSDQIYNIRYEGQLPSLAVDRPSVFVDEFMHTAGLDQEAIMVQMPSGEQLSLSGAAWADPPADIIRDYLVNEIRATAKMRAYGEGALDVRVGCRLAVKLLDFQLDGLEDPSKTDRGSVNVGLEMVLMQVSSGKILAEKNFGEKIKIETKGNESIIQAFQLGTSHITSAAAQWVQRFESQCQL